MSVLTREDVWLLVKTRILCSRPFLALHVLLGRPLMYKMPGVFYIREPLDLTNKVRVIGCTFDVNYDKKEI